MRISSITINEVKDRSGSLKAFVNVVFDDVLAVRGFRVMDGKNGLFVSMPSEKGRDGKYYDIVYPITKNGRESISNTIIKAYKDKFSDDL